MKPLVMRLVEFCHVQEHFQQPYSTIDDQLMVVIFDVEEEMNLLVIVLNKMFLKNIKRKAKFKIYIFEMNYV